MSMIKYDHKSSHYHGHIPHVDFLYLDECIFNWASIVFDTCKQQQKCCKARQFGLRRERENASLLNMIRVMTSKRLIAPQCN